MDLNEVDIHNSILQMRLKIKWWDFACLVGFGFCVWEVNFFMKLKKLNRQKTKIPAWGLVIFSKECIVKFCRGIVGSDRDRGKKAQ